MRTKILTTMCLASLVAGCGRSGLGPNGRPAPRQTPRQAGSVSSSTAAKPSGSLSRRVVYAKEEPATLYTRVGAFCKVTPNRFKETAVGDNVWCNWENARTP